MASAARTLPVPRPSGPDLPASVLQPAISLSRWPVRLAQRDRVRVFLLHYLQTHAVNPNPHLKSKTKNKRLKTPLCNLRVLCVSLVNPIWTPRISPNTPTPTPSAAPKNTGPIVVRKTPGASNRPNVPTSKAALLSTARGSSNAPAAPLCPARTTKNSSTASGRSAPTTSSMLSPSRTATSPTANQRNSVPKRCSRREPAQPHEEFIGSP